MTTETRLVVTHGTSRPQRYIKRDLAHAEKDLAPYHDGTYPTTAPGTAWIEQRDVTEWVPLTTGTDPGQLPLDGLTP